MGKGFQTSYLMTLGADFAIKRLGGNIIQIWDFAGQYSFKSIRNNYYQGAVGVILVFDKTRPESFEHLDLWIDEVLLAKSELIPTIIVGNKNDLCETKDCVERVKIDAYLEKLEMYHGHKVPYLESSALSGLNIDTLFDNLVDEIIKRYPER
jgi:small GTP-binding protein